MSNNVTPLGKPAIATLTGPVIAVVPLLVNVAIKSVDRVLRFHTGSGAESVI